MRSLLRRCSRLGHCFAISAYSASPGSAKQRANNGPRQDFNRIFFCVTIFYPLFYPLSSSPFSPVPSFSTTSLYPFLLILRLWIRWDTTTERIFRRLEVDALSFLSWQSLVQRRVIAFCMSVSLYIYISRFISAFRSFSSNLAKRRIETSVFTWTQRGHKESEICIESCSTCSPRDPVVFGHHETQETQVESSPQDFGRW